jgi:hypothetical protein
MAFESRGGLGNCVQGGRVFQAELMLDQQVEAGMRVPIRVRPATLRVRRTGERNVRTSLLERVRGLANCDQHGPP